MTQKRFYFVLIGVFALLIVGIIGLTYLGSSILQKQSKELKTLKVKDKATEQQQIALAQAKKDIEKYKDLDKITKSVVPQDKDQAKTVREISKLASEAGIKLNAFSFQSSNLGQASTTTPSQSQGTTAPTATPASPPLSQVKPVDGIPGLYSLEITITPAANKISYQSFLTFLEKLENNRRTAHVDKITVTPSSDGTVSFSLTLKAYVKP